MTNSQNRPSSGGTRGQLSPPQSHPHPKVPSASPGATNKGSSAKKTRTHRSPSGVTYFSSQSSLYFTPVKSKIVTTNGGFSPMTLMSSSPPNFSHFAGSKCYEAPAPTALPRPPDHWKLPMGSTTPAKPCGMSDGDIFSHNLKVLLNIKA